MDIITILENSLSQDKNQREAASKYLEDASQVNFVEFMRSLAEVLRNASYSDVARMQAGLQLKNQLYSKNVNTKAKLQDRWLALPVEHREFVKENCLLTLGTEQHSSASQCVAYIACTEIPTNNWPNLMQILVQNVVSANSSESLKTATLETIGYICQDIWDPSILSSQANEILTAIVNGMKKEETSDTVRLAATNALLNSLEFTKQNFDIEAERDYIMQVVCEATQCADPRIKVAALQCLVKIMSLYYQYMETYMNLALFAITYEAMKSDNDEVALQGIEFWSTVCEEEIDLAIDAQESEEKGLPPSVSSKHYAKGALHYLVPILTLSLSRQEELDDEDEWNPCKAAGVCLMLLAQCAEDAIVSHIIPFVTEHIKSPNWRFRDAAVLAFGSILEGPEPSNLRSLVENALPVIIELLRDSSNVVRDTAAWTIGRVCETLPELVIQEHFLNPLLQGLAEGLNAEARVARNVCWAFSSLAEAAYQNADKGDKDEPPTYCLSTYYDLIISKLLETSSRPDAGQHNLRNAAYHALMELLKYSARDCYTTVQNTTLVIMEKLKAVQEMESKVQTTHERAQFNELQSMLSATLQSVLQKIDKEDAPKISDAVMELLLRMLTMQQDTANIGGDEEEEGTHVSGVHEDALLAVSALVETLGEGFVKYMAVFKPILMNCLLNTTETQVCSNALGVLGDMCHAMGGHLGEITDEVFVVLTDLLTSSHVDKSVKPQVISAFSDLALALGTGFYKYLTVVINTLQQASQAQVDINDVEQVDYLNELRNACLEAYTGIIQGLKSSGGTGELQSIQPAVQHMLSFVAHCAQDAISTDEVYGSACGLVGDLVTAYGVILLPMVDNEIFNALLQKGRRSKASKTKTLAVWATKEIRKLKNQTQQ